MYLKKHQKKRSDTMKENKNTIIKQNAEIDKCLKNEIGFLNNVEFIRTIGCCCGHGKHEDAYISVFDDEDTIKMIEQRYNIKQVRIGLKTNAYDSMHGKLHNDKSLIINIYFQPKSKCICKNRGK